MSKKKGRMRGAAREEDSGSNQPQLWLKTTMPDELHLGKRSNRAK
ncbi:MAG TPA: hypothetical protein VGK36_24290 [Candidatus Angelobacter sp.]|jgi:hypothetical protein